MTAGLAIWMAFMARASGFLLIPCCGSLWIEAFNGKQSSTWELHVSIPVYIVKQPGHQ